MVHIARSRVWKVCKFPTFWYGGRISSVCGRWQKRKGTLILTIDLLPLNLIGHGYSLKVRLSSSGDVLRTGTFCSLGLAWYGTDLSRVESELLDNLNTQPFFLYCLKNRSVFESDRNQSSVQQTVQNLFGSFLLILVDRLGLDDDQIVLYATGSGLADNLDTHRIGCGIFFFWFSGSFIHPPWSGRQQHMLPPYQQPWSS